MLNAFMNEHNSVSVLLALRISQVESVIWIFLSVATLMVLIIVIRSYVHVGFCIISH